MIKYRRTDKIGGDETAPYDVIFDREYTVREFIEYILTRNEWGNIRFIGGSSYGYRQNQLLYPIPDRYMETRIASVKAAGGWSNKVVINSGVAMNHFISIQAAADEYGISTRWIWKSIRVDRTLGTVVRNGRIYLRRIEWEAFVERHPRLIEEWHDLHAHRQYRYIGQ